LLGGILRTGIVTVESTVIVRIDISHATTTDTRHQFGGVRVTFFLAIGLRITIRIGIGNTAATDARGVLVVIIRAQVIAVVVAIII